MWRLSRTGKNQLSSVYNYGKKKMLNVLNVNSCRVAYIMYNKHCFIRSKDRKQPNQSSGTELKALVEFTPVVLFSCSIGRRAALVLYVNH